MQNPKIDKDEVARRVSVYAKQRRTVLIKLAGSGIIEGLPKKERDEQAAFIKHVEEAEKRDLDPRAYRRDNADTGHQWCNNEGPLRIERFVADLAEAGLNFCGGHWFDRDGKSAMNVLEFSTDSDRWVEMPEAVQKALALRYQKCTLWCNLRYNDEEDPAKGQHRLDTANLLQGHASAKPARNLRLNGNTYAFEAAPVTVEAAV